MLKYSIHIMRWALTGIPREGSDVGDGKRLTLVSLVYYIVLLYKHMYNVLLD